MSRHTWLARLTPSGREAHKAQIAQSRRQLLLDFADELIAFLQGSHPVQGSERMITADRLAEGVRIAKRVCWNIPQDAS